MPPAQSINKIGHGLALHDPVFRRHTFESTKIKTLAQDLGAHKSPRVLQSMIICKQPRIGGTGGSIYQSTLCEIIDRLLVPIHMDSTFLYTDPPSAVGAWIALEDCTTENGCLVLSNPFPHLHPLTLYQSFLPGSHKLARCASRFVRDSSGHGTTFIPVDGVAPNTEIWEDMPGWKEAPCPKGTLVLIHGELYQLAGWMISL